MEEERKVITDRKGHPIKVIYRDRNAMKPAPTGVKNDKSNARRLRQMARAKAKR